mgnify:CR=1 FL=1
MVRVIWNRIRTDLLEMKKKVYYWLLLICIMFWLFVLVSVISSAPPAGKVSEDCGSLEKKKEAE